MSSGGSPPTWWEVDPERLELERAHLAEIAPITEQRIDEDGCLNLDIALPSGSGSLPVTVRFRPGHPFLPPVLSAEPGTIERHQNPNDGHFCLVDNEEHWWRPSHRAADLLTELVRLLEASAANTVAEGELAMPEPLTGYLANQADYVALVHEPLLVTELATNGGEFVLREYRPHGYLVESIDGVDAAAIALPPALLERFDPERQGRTHRGRWKAIDPPPAPTDLPAILEEALRELGELAEPFRKKRGRGRRNPIGAQLWTARTFLEEGPRRGDRRRAWVFYQAVLDRQAKLDSAALVTTQALSEAARAERLRELGGLGETAFLIVGAGALGAPVAGELSRAGAGDIDLIDPDRYDLNNSVRHPLPIQLAGEPKSAGVAAWASSLNPFASVREHQFAVGREDPERLARLIAAADVVLDATGLHVVTRLLHQQCAAHETPLISAALSPGGYGGRIIRLTGASPCFDCFLDSPEVPRPLEDPPEDEMSTPYGCSHPAASCAGFDVTELSANLARTAVRAVAATGYPALDFDWAVVNFRPGAERWAQGDLKPLPSCGCTR